MAGAGHKAELLRFYLAFGRLLRTPARYLYKDLDKLITMHEGIAHSSDVRRPAGRPAAPGGSTSYHRSSSGRTVVFARPAHIHLCDHTCTCDDENRPQCTVCIVEIEALERTDD